MRVDIIEETSDFLLINKPAGVVVNRAESVKAATIQDWIEKRLPVNKRLERSGIVHRLDKDTSGCLLIAKTAMVFRQLQVQFKARIVSKEYLALAHGKLSPRQGGLSLPVGRSPVDRKKFMVLASGKPAQTTWQVISYFEKDKEALTYLRLKPKTGRTHQLRVHMKHLGHPLVSDRGYLSRKQFKKDVALLKRQFLHAEKLSFELNGKLECFRAELAVDLQQVLDRL